MPYDLQLDGVCGQVCPDLCLFLLFYILLIRTTVVFFVMSWFINCNSPTSVWVAACVSVQVLVNLGNTDHKFHLCCEKTRSRFECLHQLSWLFSSCSSQLAQSVCCCCPTKVINNWWTRPEAMRTRRKLFLLTSLQLIADRWRAIKPVMAKYNVITRIIVCFTAIKCCRQVNIWGGGERHQRTSKVVCRCGVRLPGFFSTRGATRARGTFNLVSCCKNFHHRQTSSLLTEMKEWTSQRKKVAVIFLLWRSKTGWMEAECGQGCFAAVFVKHVLELQGAARWENGTLWKKTGREESGGKGGRSLMRPRECL